MKHEIQSLDAATLTRLAAMLDWFDKLPQSEKSRSRPPEPLGDRIWGYMVLTPQAGIPALSITAGTDTGTGTGDLPGSTSCQVWKKNRSTGGMEYAGFDIEVFNLGDVAVPGSIYVKVTRDAFGDFYVGLPIQTDPNC